MKIDLSQHLDQYEILLKVIDLFGKDAVYSHLTKAKTSKCLTSLEIEGKLLGGDLKISLTFDPDKL